MKLVYYFSRCINKITRLYRNRVFYERTGQKANLVGPMTLINTNLKIGNNVTIYPYTQFFGDGLIEIGDNVDIGTGTVVYSSKNGGVKIGKNTVIAAQCYIIDMDHGTSAESLIQEQNNIVSPVKIGEDVWVAAGCKILKGSIIENGAVIGAQAVVKGYISENSIAVGIPAKEIRKRI